MITLSSGDKWIIDNKELEGISDKDRKAFKIPETPIREFCYKLMEKDNCYFPRKWTPQFDGFWNPDFDVYAEVFGYIALKSIKNDFSKVYEMPWGEIFVVYIDRNGCDPITEISVFQNREEYNRAVTL